MAEILGLATTDFPFLRAADGNMTGVLKGALARGVHYTTETKDPANWPEQMRREWGDDEGLAVGKEKRAKQIEQFRKLRAALDEFKPDFILMWSKDNRESLGNGSLPPFWIQAHTSTEVKPGLSFFGEDPDKVVTIKGHQEGAFYLINGLQETGFDVTYSLEPKHANGLAHTFVGILTHLDWDKHEYAIPAVPVSINPFANRERGGDGLSPINPTDPWPLSPKRAFDLGRATARVLRASPWRVALVAGVGWSHAQNTSWDHQWVHPDIESDRRFHEQWKSNQFDKWGEITYKELEDTANWELLNFICLAGAMTELGAKVVHSDMQENWAFNSNWVNTIFSVA